MKDREPLLPNLGNREIEAEQRVEDQAVGVLTHAINKLQLDAVKRMLKLKQEPNKTCRCASCVRRTRNDLEAMENLRTGGNPTHEYLVEGKEIVVTYASQGARIYENRD